MDFVTKATHVYRIAQSIDGEILMDTDSSNI